MGTSTAAPLMLSISGLRGIVGESFTTDVARLYATAFAGWIDEGRPGAAAAPRICVARDGRRGGEAALGAVRDALQDAGCEVIDLGIAMTPTVGVAIAHHRGDGALVVTASHNPQQWNGLKALDSSGLAPPPERAAPLMARFKALRDGVGSAAATARVSRPRGAATEDSHAAERHVERVLQLVDVPAIRRAGFSVVLDSINASGAIAGRMLLERLGCRLTHLNGDLSGVFSHTPEPLETNLGELIAATPRAGAAVGFAQDPDADRLALVDERGRYPGEEYTLALAVWRMLERRGAGVLAANLSTSRLIDAVAGHFAGSRVIRTAVGEANVAAALRREHGLIGGEGNGGVIVPSVTWVRDSLSAMALTLDLLAGRGRPLSEIVAQLPPTAMVKSKLDLAAVGGAAAVAPALERVKQAWSHASPNTVDGVRVDLDDGWVHLRASNTEPIIRIIAEAPTLARANALVDECRRLAGLP
ncbi:MAG: hypothetical protein KF724_03335 [Phycisphaeraceae bacterium]|nr:hypothetical protein [Phycisphaeraceae bacterium]